MSTRVRWTVAGGLAVLLAVMAVLWLAVLSPRLDEAGRLDQQAIDLETANLGLLNTYNRSLELMTQAPQAAEEAQRLFAAMPQQADLPRVLELITEAATDAGIAPEDVETLNTTIPTPIAPEAEAAPADPAEQEAGEPAAGGTAGIALAQLDVAVTATGTQQQALDFLDNLQRLDRVMLVTSSRILESAEQGAGDRWSIQVTGTMFVLQSRLPDLVRTVDELLAQAQTVAGTSPAQDSVPSVDRGQ